MADEIADRLGQIQVDVRHLDGIERYLKELVPEIDGAKNHARLADESVRGPGPGGGSAFGSRAIPVVEDLMRCLVGTRDTVAANLTNVADGHHHTADNMARIARLYRSTEERNRLSAAKVGEHLKGG